jgi:hypothetical protein
MSIEDTVLDLEGRFWMAAGDPDFYRENFADDGVMAFHIGVMGKEDVVDAMSGAEEWESYTIDDPRFVQVSDDVAALTYTTAAFSPGSDEPYEAAITSVYAYRDGRWLLVLHQQTPLG